MTYKIAINEEQRKVIELALRQLNQADVKPPMNIDAKHLLSLFTTLPDDEFDNPKTLHGFCY